MIRRPPRSTLFPTRRSSDLLIAPHVRVLLGLSYYKADFSSAARARFEQRLKSVVIDPSADDTIRLGRITWSDVTGDVDQQYVLPQGRARSEEHTSELQSRLHLVCRLLLEKKKN